MYAVAELCLARAVVIRLPNSVTSPYKINVRVEYKRLSLTHKALTTAQLGLLICTA